MDACDELGLFVIVATPGWQYWNKDLQFGELVHRNTREMIRRDRNHPSVLMWEPILNETRYPLDFALKALDITKEEYPYPGRPVAAADVHSAGVKEHYDVVQAAAGENIRCWCRHFLWLRVMMRCIALRACLSVVPSGIRSITNEGITLTHIGEVFMMLFVRKNMHTRCSAVSLQPVCGILWLSVDPWFSLLMKCRSSLIKM